MFIRIQENIYTVFSQKNLLNLNPFQPTFKWKHCIFNSIKLIDRVEFVQGA